MGDQESVDPRRVHTLHDLTMLIARLRRHAAGRGQVQISVRDLAKASQVPPSTLSTYLVGRRLIPEDAYERVLTALGVRPERLRPWLDAWERVAERTAAESGPEPVRSLPVSVRDETEYRLVPPTRSPDSRVGLVTGVIERIRGVELWVNSENTAMRMARFEEFAVSAVIRYEGAVRDSDGRVLEDLIADELEDIVRDMRPLQGGSVVVTGPGTLAVTHGVRHILHVAAVYGETGAGYHQIRDVGRCVTNVCEAAERLCDGDGSSYSLLFPLLGVGTGGGDVRHTVSVMLGATIDHLSARESLLRTVYFLAYNQHELAACRAVLDASPRIAPAG